MLRSVLRVPQRLALARVGRAKKASGWKKGKKTEASSDGPNKNYDLYLRCIEPEPREIEPLTADQLETGEKLAKQYTRMMWKRTSARDKDYQQKIRLKWAAIAALPSEELRVEALTVTDFTVPMHKQVPGWTPPQSAGGGAGFGEYQLDEDVLRAQASDDGFQMLGHSGGDGSL